MEEEHRMREREREREREIERERKLVSILGLCLSERVRFSVCVDCFRDGNNNKRAGELLFRYV